MKAVLVGAGFAGRAHAAALRACGVEIAAVVTPREESARAFAKVQIPASSQIRNPSCRLLIS